MKKRICFFSGDTREFKYEEMERLFENERQMKEMREGFKQDITPLKNDVELMKKGMQKDIRRSLRQDGEAMVKRGYATQSEKTEFDELY